MVIKLNNLIGLAALKERARIDIAASKLTGEPFPHSLIHGCGGIGKTSLVRAIAGELDYHLIEKEAASFRHRGDIVECLHESNEIVKRRGKRLLLFIDECHRLTCRQQEVFYFPMIEHRVDEGNDNWYRLQPFTLFCATTQMDRLDVTSFVSRFQNVWAMEPLHSLIIEQILQRQFDSYSLKYEPAALQFMASACQGLPRLAVQLAIKMRNFLLVYRRQALSTYDVKQVLTLEKLR